MDLLSPEAHDLVRRERAFLERLRTLLNQTQSLEASAERLGEIAEGLDALFMIVVVGEFNAGKSSVVNALFGEKLMAEGPIPTTAKVTILRYGEEEMERQLTEFLVERRYPADVLKTLALVDTPGTNSIVRQHQEITERFIPRSDLVLFVTSYDRPLTETEGKFLEFIRDDWGRRLVFVLNKADLAQSEADVRTVIAHIQDGAFERVGIRPQVFPVSAREAFDAKLVRSPKARADLMEASRFGPFERFVFETLTGRDLLALKLHAPLDASEKLVAAVEERLDARADVLSRDEANLDLLARRQSEARADLDAFAQGPLGEIDALLGEMERRGVKFLDNTIRVSGLKLLRDKDAFKEEFARQVVRQADRQIEEHVSDGVDRILEQALRLREQVFSEFAERVREAGQGAAPRVANLPGRSSVVAGVMREAERKIETFDLQEEARRLLETARDAATVFLGAEAAAVGLGVLGGVLVAATTADVFGGLGMATGVTIAAAGLFVLPTQRRRAIAEFRDQVDKLRTGLRDALTRSFTQEADLVLGQVNEAAQPYVAFVSRERDALADARALHADVTTELAALRADVTAELGEPAI